MFLFTISSFFAVAFSISLFSDLNVLARFCRLTDKVATWDLTAEMYLINTGVCLSVTFRTFPYPVQNPAKPLCKTTLIIITHTISNRTYRVLALPSGAASTHPHPVFQPVILSVPRKMWAFAVYTQFIYAASLDSRTEGNHH